MSQVPFFLGRLIRIRLSGLPSRSESGNMVSILSAALCHCAWHWARQPTNACAFIAVSLYIFYFLDFVTGDLVLTGFQLSTWTCDFHCFGALGVGPAPWLGRICLNPSAPKQSRLQVLQTGCSCSDFKFFRREIATGEDRVIDAGEGAEEVARERLRWRQCWRGATSSREWGSENRQKKKNIIERAAI